MPRDKNENPMTSKDILFSFVHGNNSPLHFDQNSLKVREGHSASLVETIQAICQLLTQTKICDELTSEEKIAFSKKIKHLNGQAGHAALRKIFFETVKDHDVLTALNEGAYEFILEAFSKSRFDSYLYTNFNTQFIEWISKKEQLSKCETYFAFKVLPYLEDKTTVLRKIAKRLNLSQISIDPMDLIRLNREAGRCKIKKIERAIENHLIHTDVSFFLEIGNILNEVTHHIYAFSPLEYPSILSFLNELFPAKTSLICKLLESKQSKIFAAIFLEIAFELDPNKEAEELIKLVLQTLGPSAFFEIIHKNPHLQHLIRHKKHGLIRPLFDIPSLSEAHLEMALKSTDLTPNGTMVELAFQKKQFDALSWLIKNGGPLTHIRSIFAYNPPVPILKELVRKKSLGFNAHDLQLVLTHGSSELIDAARELFPVFKILLEQSDFGFNDYCSNPAANPHQFNQLFFKKLERLNTYYQVLALPKNSKDEKDPVVEFIFQASKKSSLLFLSIVDSNPALYRLASKDALLQSSLMNKNVLPSHLLRLIKDGAELTPALIYQTLLIKNYQLGFLKDLSSVAPRVKQTLAREMNNKNSELSLNHSNLSLNPKLLSDLYDFFVQESPYELLNLIIKIINFLKKPELITILFSFLQSKKQDSNFSNFFYLSENIDIHPLCFLSSFYLPHFNKEHLRCLSQIGSYKIIFGKKYNLLRIFLIHKRYDLIHEYLHLDPTLFDRQSSPVKGSFLFSIFKKLFSGQFHYTKGEFFTQLGLRGTLECLRLGVQINLEADIPNPLFCFLKNNLRDSTLHHLTKDQFQPLLKFLHQKDNLGRSPLFVALSTGAYSHALCYLKMGASLTEGGQFFFDNLFKNQPVSKKIIFEYLYYHRIPCGHLLFDERHVNAFENGMRIGTDETVAWLLKLLPLNLPSFEKLKKALLYISENRPKYLVPYMEALPEGFFRTLLPKELLSFFEVSLRIFDTSQNRDLKAHFVHYFLFLVDPNLQFENVSLLQIALKNGDFKSVLAFFNSKKFKPKYQLDILKKWSLPHLLDVYLETKNLILFDILEKRIEPQIHFVKELIELGLLSPKQLQPIADLTIRRMNNKVGEDIISLIPFYFAISRQLYQTAVLETELPEKEDTSYFTNLLSLFADCIPKGFTLPDDDGETLTTDILSHRLTKLVEYIENETNYSGVEANAAQFYARIRNKICWILDWITERNDPELTQQVVGFIARSGPGGHCGTRWVDEIDRFCNFLGPQIHPQNLNEWLLLKLNDFRVSCFYQTADQFPHKFGSDYELHVRNLLRFFIQQDRGIHMKGGNNQDPFGGSFKKSQALKVFDSLHTVESLFNFTLEVINGPLKLYEMEWVIQGLKSYSHRFPIPQEIIDLRSQQKIIAARIDQELKMVRTDPFIQKVQWKKLCVHYKNKIQFTEAVSNDCDEVLSLIRQANPNLKALHEELKVASFQRKLEIFQLLRGSALFENFIKEKPHHDLISHAIFSSQINQLDASFQAYARDSILKEKIQSILRTYELGAEDYSRLLKGTIDSLNFVNLAIAEKQKDLILHSLYRRDDNHELLYFNAEGEIVPQETPGARSHFRELAALLLLDHIGAFQKK